MRNCKIILISLFLSLSFQAKAEENYWKIIYQLLETGTSETGMSFDEYISSLTAEQLLIAARQCSVEIQQNKPEDWEEASTMCLSYFFYQQYPQKTNNLADISPLLNDLKDKSQLPIWRYGIMQFLGGIKRQNMLSAQQCFDTAGVMKTIVADVSEPVNLRVEAAKESNMLFKRAYSGNLCQDPQISRLIESGRKYSDAVKDAERGKITIAKETFDKNSQIEAAIAESIDAQLALFAEPDMPVYLRRLLIASLAELRSYDSGGRIKQAMSDALQNYKNYDEEVWQQLARTNIVYFENENAEQILQQMIDDAKDEHVKKDNLMWFKRRLDKGEVEKKSLTSSLVQLPEPVVLEPVDVNEMVNWLEQIRSEDMALQEIMDANQWEKFIEAIKQQK